MLVLFLKDAENLYKTTSVLFLKDAGNLYTTTDRFLHNNITFRRIATW